MPRILAIEADPRRRNVLTALVREHVKADLLVVASVGAAIASIAERTPDLIVAPTLLAPADEADLRAHMKQLHDAPYVQMVTLPALDMLVDAPREESARRGLFGSVFGRRAVSLGLKYDRNMVATQIADGLQRAREHRLEYAAALAYNEAAAQRAALSTQLVRSIDLQASDEFVSQQLRDAARDERRVALRKGRGDVPWLSGIKLSWGQELKLVNISSTGVLVETGSKLAPGSTTELHLSGPETNLVVPARVIRSDVARINGLGVRYHAAAAFANKIDLNGPRRRSVSGSTPAQDLAMLLGDVLDKPRDGREPAHARFAHGLQQLIAARDVQVCTGAAGGAGGRETLYFDVPGDDRARRTLQVMFEGGHDVTDEEFRLLKAAAWMTAAVIELDKPAAPAAETSMALLAECVA